MSSTDPLNGPMVTPDRFKDKVMLITGAARGIGEATARWAAREGAKLILTDILADQGEAVASSIRSEGLDAVFVAADISKPDDVRNVVQTAIGRYSRLDVGINNADIIGNMSPIQLTSLDDWNLLIQANLAGVFLCCREELKIMTGQNSGVIVNIGSIEELTGLPENEPYVASKHGVIGLTRQIADGYARHSIRCNACYPTGSETSMRSPGNITQELINRNSTLWEQAGMVLYLASNESSHMTGALITSDSGWKAF